MFSDKMHSNKKILKLSLWQKARLLQAQRGALLAEFTAEDIHSTGLLFTITETYSQRYNIHQLISADGGFWGNDSVGPAI